MKSMDGQVVVITGASSGLGAQLARAVGAAGGTRSWPRAVPSASRR